MDVKISVNIDEDKIQAMLRREISLASEQRIRTATNNGKFGPKGEVYSALEDVLNSVISSDKTHEIIKRVVERDWERMLEEATVSALQHKANKMAFTHVKGKLPIGVIA